MVRTSETDRIRVLVLFGGRSSEHEVSCLSARGVLWAIDTAVYDVVAVGITKDGRWTLMPRGVPQTREGTLPAVPDDGALVTLATTTQGSVLLELGPQGPVDHGRIDVCFPVLHGPYGEDGTIQGYLATAGVPYVGADVASSAIAVDKRQMKHVFAAAGLPQVEHEVVMRPDWDVDRVAELDRLEGCLPYPLFTKPARQGSSIGITRVANRAQLETGIDEALGYDRVVIVERGLDHVRELECGVIGNDTIRVTPPGETIHTGAQFYDFDAKYLEPVQLQCPAAVPEAVASACQEYAVAAYRAIGARGMARIDFFLDTVTDTLLVNEINTIPGLTPQSMFPPVWEATGLAFKDLIGTLLDLAMEASRLDSRFSP
ncbi:MAG: D-alanine--D-alanine ligase family protein [Euzebya sp.]